MPSPIETELRVHASPVPTQTFFGFFGSIAMAPIDCTGCLSKTGLNVVPPSTDFQTPPLAAPTKSVTLPSSRDAGDRRDAPAHRGGADVAGAEPRDRAGVERRTAIGGRERPGEGEQREQQASRLAHRGILDCARRRRECEQACVGGHVDLRLVEDDVLGALGARGAHLVRERNGDPVHALVVAEVGFRLALGPTHPVLVAHADDEEVVGVEEDVSVSPSRCVTLILCASVPSTSSVPRYSSVKPFDGASTSGPSMSASSGIRPLLSSRDWRSGSLRP